jgi:hypothetical protein
VLTVDGNIAPCRGAFQSSDDITRLDAGGDRGAATTFREAWNHERYRMSRSLFHRRGGGAEQRRLVCYECPTAIFWERWQAHHRRGGSLESFDPGMDWSANGAWNYFWARGQRKTGPSSSR